MPGDLSVIVWNIMRLSTMNETIVLILKEQVSVSSCSIALRIPVASLILVLDSGCPNSITSTYRKPCYDSKTTWHVLRSPCSLRSRQPALGIPDPRAPGPLKTAPIFTSCRMSEFLENSPFSGAVRHRNFKGHRVTNTSPPTLILPESSPNTR